jgi:hypothetical protein
MATVYFTSEETRRSFEIKKLLEALCEGERAYGRRCVRKLTEEPRRRKADLSTKRLWNQGRLLSFWALSDDRVTCYYHSERNLVSTYWLPYSELRGDWSVEGQSYRFGWKVKDAKENSINRLQGACASNKHTREKCSYQSTAQVNTRHANLSSQNKRSRQILQNISNLPYPISTSG